MRYHPPIGYREFGRPQESAHLDRSISECAHVASDDVGQQVLKGAL
jgi:hypothetical protein